MKRWFILAFLALALVSCAPDPRNQADADVARLAAEQNAADQAQARAQNAKKFDQEYRQSEAVSGQWVASLTDYVFWAMKALTVASVVAVLGAGMAIAWVAVGSARAFSQGAWVRAHLIQLDPETRQYPLILQRVDVARWTLTDPNTGDVMMLDMRQAGDRQRIATAGAIRLSGTVAHASRLSNDPAGVAMVGTSPVVVNGGDDGQ